MIAFDVVVVSYNSEKWLKGFFKSLENNKYDLKKISLIFVDNSSVDQTVSLLREYENAFQGVLGSFQILEMKKNMGFGAANNKGAHKAVSDKLFFLNVDTEIHAQTFFELEKEILTESNSVFKAWELRQTPYEHPKLYDPITSETPWASAAALVIDKACFKEIGGFDDHLFMYGEDVDISWRILLKGYKIKYVPKATVTHYSYESIGKVKPLQYYYSIINHLYLRFKYGNVKEILKGGLLLRRVLIQKSPFERGRKKLVGLLLKNSFNYLFALLWNLFHFVSISKNKGGFYGVQLIDWDYSLRRKGDFYENSTFEHTLFISVIIRSYNRPIGVIRETLFSLRKQTYTNFEVVLVEDGSRNAEGIIKEFPDLRINYIPLPENKGRSYVGNIGMANSKGECFNFLDDDDVFFADHLEVLAREFLKEKEQVKAVFSLAFASPITIHSEEPYKYTIHDYRLDYNYAYNPLRLIVMNYLPIQCILFSRELFLQEGGFDESIDYLEDWDLWFRYGIKNRFKMVEKVTSVYRIPFVNTIFEERLNKLRSTEEYVFQKHNKIQVNTTVEQLREFVCDIK